ncbi:hypothetical protein CR161_07595 [Prosthecochloris sp. ZM]|uniref:hypothetical protein n=1 Tax=Prosthecochloris sp. ZM TaxID=2283143 RepID=UPI000E194D1A|nr:hypothetical protein [Prosthecochloris sp. ZM]RDD30585.1 hypothetical protein CR161_07595 [Prosthecochloris sp. ZM]
MSTTKITDMGLAEFVAGLISETFEAVTASQEEQVRREAEMRAAHAMSSGEFRKRYLPEGEVRQLVGDAAQEYFGTAIEPNMAYAPADTRNVEHPAFQDVLGITLQEKVDYAKASGVRSMVVTEKGVRKIEDALLDRVIVDQQQVILQVLNRGIARIVVDTGKIFSRVSFSLVEHEASTSDNAAVSGPTPIVRSIVSKRAAVMNRLSRNRSNLVMPGVEFRVRQADDQAPQSSKADLYGEVEIHFRTVS